MNYVIRYYYKQQIQNKTKTLEVLKMKFNFFKRLTHGERVSMARQQAEEALGLFTKAHNQLELANTELANVVSEAKRQAEEFLLHVENATLEINMNKAVQDKLKDFIVQ